MGEGEGGIRGMVRKGVNGLLRKSEVVVKLLRMRFSRRGNVLGEGSQMEGKGRGSGEDSKQNKKDREGEGRHVPNDK